MELFDSSWRPKQLLTKSERDNNELFNFFRWDRTMNNLRASTKAATKRDARVGRHRARAD